MATVNVVQTDVAVRYRTIYYYFFSTHYAGIICMLIKQIHSNYMHAAVCNQPCVNGGSCSGPNVCECPPGWTGDRCHTGIYDIVC